MHILIKRTKSDNKTNHRSGQALVILLVIMTMALTIITVGIVIAVVNSLAAARVQEGLLVEQMAQSGAENALLRILRSPNYTGETLPIGTGTVTIQVTGADTKIATSTAVSGNFSRSVQVSARMTGGEFKILSWREIF